MVELAECKLGNSRESVAFHVLYKIQNLLPETTTAGKLAGNSGKLAGSSGKSKDTRVQLGGNSVKLERNSRETQESINLYRLKQQDSGSYKIIKL